MKESNEGKDVISGSTNIRNPFFSLANVNRANHKDHMFKDNKDSIKSKRERSPTTYTWV